MYYDREKLRQCINMGFISVMNQDRILFGNVIKLAKLC